jgi:hypothetical protein
MRYVYENRDGKQEDFAQSLPESVIHNFGYTLIGHSIGGVFHSIERGHRVKRTQDPSIEAKEYVECNKLLNGFGILQ